MKISKETLTFDSVDYPDFGIVICGSGNEIAVTANKHLCIRAGLD